MNSIPFQEIEKVIIKFAGDSGDGMQLTGTQFTNNSALLGLDIATFPDFPAEIRAPQGTLHGVSGFQVHFSSQEVHTPGDSLDVLVAMNAAALKTSLPFVKKNGILIVNSDGFDDKNLRLANFAEGDNPLHTIDKSIYTVIEMPINKLTREALQDFKITTKEKDRAKNMFVLGVLYWIYSRDMASTEAYLQSKFGKSDDLLQSNLKALHSGYHYAETTELFSHRYSVKKATMKPGLYRSITGNSALAYGLIAAADNIQLPLFLGSYPITPASDILHELSQHKNFGVKTFQAEDEIAGISAAIGASYGGHIGITTTSGPGMTLKTEAMGLAVMLEIPLIIINVQRAGPSTGMPTKTEQADLLQAYYGRNGECPMPVLSTSTPSDCFMMAYEAVRIALEHATPVILLSDGYIANGSEPWKIPDTTKDLQQIQFAFKTALEKDEKQYLPYSRDEKLVRPIVVPGTPNLQYRIGGLEKQHNTGNISYDADNHEKMVLLRQAKIDRIADYIPLQQIACGHAEADTLIVGWGSTYGVIREVVEALSKNGKKIAQAHIHYLRPFPKNLGELLRQYKKIIVPEINNGQLIKILRDAYFIDAIPYNKIKGSPITSQELTTFILSQL